MERTLKKRLPGGIFTNVPQARSKLMAGIRGKNNRSTEQRLRFALVRAGIRGWRLSGGGLAGRPDFFFEEARLAVFVDGCFWHACPRCGHGSKTRTDFWSAKFRRNRDRDKQVNEDLHIAGYEVLRFWEHQLKEDMPCVLTAIRQTVDHAVQASAAPSIV